MPDQELLSAANSLLELCKAKKLTLATAESCTGGLVAAALSEIPGSSLVLDRGFVMPDGRALEPQESAGILREHGFPVTTVVDAGRNGWRLFIGSKQ